MIPVELKGTYILQAPPTTVWTALHDTELLIRCVPGCRSIRWTAENTLAATIELRVGNARRTYSGEVRIADRQPPTHYRLLFGESGQPNSVVATIELTPQVPGTHLSYHVEAALDGYLVRLGAPVASLIAGRIAKRFFKHLNAALTEETST